MDSRLTNRLKGCFCPCCWRLQAWLNSRPVLPCPTSVSSCTRFRPTRGSSTRSARTNTYSTLETTQDIDSNGKVTKTESVEEEDFFVNGHVIARTVKKNGQPLSDHDQQKRPRALQSAWRKPKRRRPISRWRARRSASAGCSRSWTSAIRGGRSTAGGKTIVFDFVGRKDAKTHGLVEDASKKLQGTIWVDEADRQVAHLEVELQRQLPGCGWVAGQHPERLQLPL